MMPTHRQPARLQSVPFSKTPTVSSNSLAKKPAPCLHIKRLRHNGVATFADFWSGSWCHHPDLPVIGPRHSQDASIADAGNSERKYLRCRRRQRAVHACRRLAFASVHDAEDVEVTVGARWRSHRQERKWRGAPRRSIASEYNAVRPTNSFGCEKIVSRIPLPHRTAARGPTPSSVLVQRVSTSRA